MRNFTPCKGKTACRDDGTQCLTCGRSLDEIEQTRELIEAIAEFACTQGYRNPDEFVAYLADKAGKKIKHRQTP